LSGSLLQATFRGQTPPFSLIRNATSAVTAGNWQIQDGANTYAVAYGSGRLNVSKGSAVVASVNSTPAIVLALDGAGSKADLAPLFTAVTPPISNAATISVTSPRGWSITDGIYTFSVSTLGTNMAVPLQVTYTINDATNAALIDYTKFLSNANSPNPRPPGTPTFCANAGQPVRFRVVQPGADTDQMVEIHGHSWQQEPYTRGGLSIGHNPASQQLGTQVLSPNDRLDIVLDSAGGTFRVPGDYLYHSFMNQFAGMWGLFRVLPQGQNPADPKVCSPSSGN
jgi:hypothetical protein